MPPPDPDLVARDPVPAAAPAAAHVETPAPWLTDVRRAYIDQAALGYIMYLLGAISAFLAGALALSDSEAGLHSTAMATGLIASGLSSHRLDARYGQRAVHLGALAVMAGAVLLIAWAPAFAVTLAGSLLLGAGVGLILAHVNAAVSAIGGARAVVQFIRATLVSMVTSASVAVVVGLGVAVGLGWQVVAVPALLFIGVAALASRGRPRQSREASTTHGRLPRAFWLPWLLTVVVVCVEFGVLFWAATMVERTTDASLADATLTISVFFFGVVLARALVSGIPVLGRTSPTRLLRVSLALAFVGVLGVWASPSYELSVVAMLVGGLGLGVLYPVSASVTLATAPGAPALASGRVVLASGTAMLLAPFVLGVAADAVGVTTAWLLIPALCVAALLLTVPVARARTQVPAP